MTIRSASTRAFRICIQTQKIFIRSKVMAKILILKIDQSQVSGWKPGNSQNQYFGHNFWTDKYFSGLNTDSESSRWDASNGTIFKCLWCGFQGFRYFKMVDIKKHAYKKTCITHDFLQVERGAGQVHFLVSAEK